jgi:hypothetical protein
MKRIAPYLPFLLLSFSALAQAQDAPATADAQAVADITAQLNDFLAHVDQRDPHDRLGACDLFNTRWAGAVTNTAEILIRLEPPAPAPADDGKASDAPAADASKDAPPAEQPVTFTADDIHVRPYGDTAALTFRLVQHGPGDKTQYYRNSGMFVRRDGRWQAVTWQATRVPEPEAK